MIKAWLPYLFLYTMCYKNFSTKFLPGNISPLNSISKVLHKSSLKIKELSLIKSIEMWSFLKYTFYKKAYILPHYLFLVNALYVLTMLPERFRERFTELHNIKDWKGLWRFSNPTPDQCQKLLLNYSILVRWSTTILSVPLSSSQSHEQLQKSLT